MKNQRGVAMLMALVTMTVLAILTAELVYQVGVYQRLVYNQVDELRAQYLADSALRLAKLQLIAAAKGKDKLKSLGGDNLNSMVDRIWQTPIILPPPVPKGLGPSATESLKKFEKSLDLNGRLSVQVTGESDRININQLVWLPNIKQTTETPVHGGTPSGGDSANQMEDEQKQQIVRERFQTLIDSVLTKKKFDDNLFRERYASVRAEDLVLNLEAWLSPKLAVSNEEDVYSAGVEEPYGIKNAPMQSISELNMVKGFDDTLVKLFSDYFTTSYTEGININRASAELLHALLPQLDDRTLSAVVARRDDPAQGPFGSVDDFWTFINTLADYSGLKDDAQARGIVLTTAETSYRVVITSESGNAHKTWVASFGAIPPDPNAKVNPNDPFAHWNEPKAKGKQNPQNQNDNKIPSILYLKTDG